MTDKTEIQTKRIWQHSVWTTILGRGLGIAAGKLYNKIPLFGLPRIPRWIENYFPSKIGPQICTHIVILYSEEGDSYVIPKLELLLCTEFNSKDIITNLIKYLSGLTYCDLECHTATVLNSTISALPFQVNCMTD